MRHCRGVWCLQVRLCTHLVLAQKAGYGLVATVTYTWGGRGWVGQRRQNKIVYLKSTFNFGPL